MKLSLPLLCCTCLFASIANTQTWDTLAPVPEKLTFPAVSVLNGKIHVIGGGGTGGASNAHYEYDPATDSWTPRAALPYLAQQPAGTAANGKIHHFGGGYPNTGAPKDDHYIFDPATDSWTAGAKLTAPRAIHSSVALNNQVYSLGGQGMANLMQVYDEANDSWSNKANLPDNSFWYGAHVVTEGKIYRFGGGGYTAPVKTANVYDPATNLWSTLPSLPNAVHAIKGAAIGKQIYLVGGYYNFVETDEVLVYDIDNQTYTPTTPLPRGRDYHNVVAIDSCIYVVGGNNAIDPDVSFQLLRFCPFVTSAAPEPASGSAAIRLVYNEGKIGIRLPPSYSGKPLSALLFNTAGQSVRTGQLTADAAGYGEMPTGNLPTGVYLLHLRSDGIALSGKVLISR